MLQPSEYDFEQSELILYQNMILRESGHLELALSKLEENSAHIVDRVAYMETRGTFYLFMAVGRIGVSCLVKETFFECCCDSGKRTMSFL